MTRLTMRATTLGFFQGTIHIRVWSGAFGITPHPQFFSIQHQLGNQPQKQIYSLINMYICTPNYFKVDTTTKSNVSCPTVNHQFSKASCITHPKIDGLWLDSPLHNPQYMVYDCCKFGQRAAGARMALRPAMIIRRFVSLNDIFGGLSKSGVAPLELDRMVRMAGRQLFPIGIGGPKPKWKAFNWAPTASIPFCFLVANILSCLQNWCPGKSLRFIAIWQM